MKTILTTVLIAALSLTATAAPRSIEDMRAIAANKFNTTASAAARRAQARNDAPKLVRFTDAYAVFEPAQAEGFVIVGRDDASRPILGYSDTPFPTTDMPDGLQWFLTQTECATKTGAPRRAEAAFTPVENFVTTKWGQDYPFNNLTPNKYPAGCVATALAQCMNVCQWPLSAAFEGQCSVTTTVGRKEKTEDQTLDIASTYTWPYKDIYAKVGRLTDNIDELLRDCGYATYMSYTSGGSGAASPYAAIALTHIFGYPEESVKYVDREEMETQEEWAQLIYDELATGSPVFYGANDEAYGGHAFVLSGVDADGLVYVNWGWRGTADGFFDLTDLNPMQGAQQMHFNSYMELVCGIRKEALPTDRISVRINATSNDPYTFSWTTMQDDEGADRPTLYIALPYGFVNFHPTDFKGVYGIFADDLTDGTSWVIDPTLQDRDTLEAGYSYGSRNEDFAFYYYVDGPNGLKPNHTYRMSFGYCDDREGQWHSIFCDYRELAYDVTYTGDIATSTVAEEPAERPLLTAIAALPAAECQGTNLAAITSEATITRVYDTTGRLIYTAPTARFNLWDVEARGILVIDDGRTRRKVVR